MLIRKITGVRVYFIPVRTRVPLKFGRETLTSVTCARVCMGATDSHGREVEGWGETPLSVQWAWPSALPHAARQAELQQFCLQLAHAWLQASLTGHALEVGWRFQEEVLPSLLGNFNARARRLDASTSPGSMDGAGAEPMPYLAALICDSPFDIALHDACGKLVGRPVYQTYAADMLPSDLSEFLAPASDSPVSFTRRWPSYYLAPEPVRQLPAWHLVGGLDPLESVDLTGDEPDDGHPVLLADWVRRDGLTCVKIKLRGNDLARDYERIVKVGHITDHTSVRWLSADFNCTVQDPAYVVEVLDRLKADAPVIFDKLLYVEQPFPYDLQAHRIAVHDIAARKPLFLDESAHDWRLVRLGRELGWNGVALKTCKTQTGAILSACWARAHGMQLMVQDLTNPMLAQIPHALLAAHVGTIMGVETNSMQFYPAVSAPEAEIHPGLYQRRNGMIDLSSVQGPGFGYRLAEIFRPLPEPALSLP